VTLGGEVAELAMDGRRVVTLAARLRSRERLLGTVVTLPCVSLAELAATAVDFVWLDLEHGALDVGDVQSLAVAARAAGASAVVRLPDGDASRLQAILDAGVDGVVLPRIESAAEAASVAERLLYPPAGSRGFAARRAQGYGRPEGAIGPGEVACLVQIESPRAVEAANAIASVDGVDALVVGCADLSLALTGSVEFEPAILRDAIEHVEAACAQAGIASGVAGPGHARLLAELAGTRSTVLVYSADVRLYAQAVDEGIAALRRELAPRAPNEEGSHVST
jgi:2-keto-3-deoxy-L-rhamnonate aldolase RhmA